MSKEGQQKSISYADDPLMFGNELFEIQEFMKEGLKINTSKSGWVVYNGEWQKPLKYLGLELWLGPNPYLRGATRNGSTWELPQSMMKIILEITQVEREIQERKAITSKSIKGLSYSHYFGLIMSWLYAHGPVQKKKLP